jgi:hypothetical protein
LEVAPILNLLQKPKPEIPSLGRASGQKSWLEQAVHTTQKIDTKRLANQMVARKNTWKSQEPSQISNKKGPK